MSSQAVQSDILASRSGFASTIGGVSMLRLWTLLLGVMMRRRIVTLVGVRGWTMRWRRLDVDVDVDEDGAVWVKGVAEGDGDGEAQERNFSGLSAGSRWQENWESRFALKIRVGN